MGIQPLRLGNKEAKIPLIQGGMGVGISLGGLAGAVAKEGGVGIISAAQIGFREPDFDRHPKEANLRAIKKEYEKARAISPDGIIGFNIMVAMRYYEEYVKAAIDAGADLIISGAGLPTELPKIAGNSEVKLAPIVSTNRSAQVILKYWDKKYKRVPDLLVIEGPEAGGHLGFTKEQLAYYGYADAAENAEIEKKDCDRLAAEEVYRNVGKADAEEARQDCGKADAEEARQDCGKADAEEARQDCGKTDVEEARQNCGKIAQTNSDSIYDREIAEILATVRSYEDAYGKKIPVAIAGGICTREQAEHVCSLGADAIQVASRFVTTVECDADIRYKEAYLHAEEKDIVLVKSPVGMPGRAILNPFMKKVMAGEKIPHTPCHQCLHKCSPAEIPYCITDALIAAAKGNVDSALLFCGKNAYRAKSLETVKEVVDSLMPERL